MRRWVVTGTLVLALGCGIGGAAAIDAHRDTQAREQAREQVGAQAETAETQVRADVSVAHTDLQADVDAARLALTAQDVTDLPEGVVVDEGVAPEVLAAAQQEITEAEGLLSTEVTILTSPHPDLPEAVEVVGSAPSAQDLQARGEELDRAVAEVATERERVARERAVAAIEPARDRLEQWETVAADPGALAALRSAVDAAAPLEGGQDPQPAEGGTLLGALHRVHVDLETARASLPEIVRGDGPTTIDGVPVVNKAFPLPDGYDPGLLPEVASAFEEMRVAAAEDGITLFVHSGYRSYSDQRVTYDGFVAEHGREWADRFSSRPGHSEHQSGLSLDANAATRSFVGTPEARWIAEHAHEHGFVVRYPEGKEEVTGYMYEPWHLRFLGVELATHLTTQGLTLEEYLGVRSEYAP